MDHPRENVEEETLLKTLQDKKFMKTEIAGTVVIWIPDVQAMCYRKMETTGVKRILRLGRPEMAIVNMRAT